MNGLFFTNCKFDLFLGNPSQMVSTCADLSINVASEASKIKINIPAVFCASREGRVRVTANREEVRHKISAELIKISQTKSEVVAITHSDKMVHACSLSHPNKRGYDYLLSITVCTQHIPNSPFLM